MALTQNQTLQHRRRLGAPGAPPTLLQGQFAINDPGGTPPPFLPRLYGGGLNGVVTLVSNQRQVELTGTQTITGDKTIDINQLHVLGGQGGDTFTTDGMGNLQWVTAEHIFPEAPTDGQIYGRNGQTESWAPVLPLSGGTIWGDVTFSGNVDFTGTVSLNGIGLVADAPADGRLYVRGNESWIILPWWDTDLVAEAPDTGMIYGRNGQTKCWEPVIPLSGNLNNPMTGPLILSGPPSAGSPPN